MLYTLKLVNIAASFSLLGSSFSLILINLFLTLIIIYLFYLVFTFLIKFIKKPKDLVSLELTAPGYHDLPQEAYEALFTAIYGLTSNRSFKERALRQKPTITFEIIANEANGMRFMVLLEERLVEDFKKDIMVSLPGASTKRVKDYLSKSTETYSKVTQFKLKRPFFYSLKEITSSTLAYQAGFMVLKPGESVTFQVGVSALNPDFNIRSLKRLENSKSNSKGWLLKISTLLISSVKSGLGLKAPGLNSAPSKIKLESPLFSVSLRLRVGAETKDTIISRQRVFKSSLSALASPGRQMLVGKSSVSSRLLEFQFANRLPSLISRKSVILSSSELASLYHFPGILRIGSELTKKSLSRSLPLDIEFKSRKNDVVIGEGVQDDKPYKLGLTKDERARHMYVIGGTGNGKTTMLANMIAQDMNNGKGLMVVDPHGDLAENLLAIVPKNRIKDVIYFNPSDIDYPVSLNLLELPRGLSRRDYLLEKDRVTESIISIFRKTFEQNDEGSSYRIERLLRNAIQTALYIEGATLFTASRLISDKYYRWKVIENLKNESLKRFWMEEFNKAGDYQRVKMSLGPLSRLDRFEGNLSVAGIIGQPKSTIDIDSLISTNKILICNLSKGVLGEDVSNLLGSVLLAKLQLAALRRQSIQIKGRKTFYLYVDEFQNYANQSFVSMFSEARKFGLGLVIAQQSPAQLKDANILDVILDNVGSLIAFRSKSSASEKIILPQLAPYIGKQEIGNLPRYSFYAKLAATEPLPPVSGKTVLYKSKNTSVTNLIINSSRRLYASPRVSKALSA